MQVHEVSITKVETISKYTKKLLEVPNSLTKVALCSLSTKLKLPTLSLVEEFKLGKALLFQMLRDSRDPLVKKVQPCVITDRKWMAKIAVENAESALKMKEMIGIVPNGRSGVHLHPQRWWSKQSTINKRKMVSKEIHHLEVSWRTKEHGPNGIVQKTAVTWGELKHMESQKLSFLIKAVYDVLPTPVNLHAEHVGKLTASNISLLEASMLLEATLGDITKSLRLLPRLWRKL